MELTRREKLSMRLWTPIFLVSGLLIFNNFPDIHWVPSIALNKPLLIIVAIICSISAIIAIMDAPYGGDPLG